VRPFKCAAVVLKSVKGRLSDAGLTSRNALRDGWSMTSLEEQVGQLLQPASDEEARRYLAEVN